MINIWWKALIETEFLLPDLYICSHAFSSFRKPNSTLSRVKERGSNQCRLMKDAATLEMSLYPPDPTHHPGGQ